MNLFTGDSPEHLYIHWPFCASRCHYCDFVALEKHEGFQLDYHKALCQEIKSFSDNFTGSSSRKIKTIFIGGGTPSLYPLELFSELFDLLRDKFDFSEVQEITLESNPSDTTLERLQAWKEFGINRLSTGVQILDDEVLAYLGRRQRNADVFKHIELAPQFFENISVDLILGLPGVTESCWDETLKTVINWPIKHVSVYFLTIHEKTKLFFKMQSGECKPWDDEKLICKYQDTVECLTKCGFKQYEISNFAKSGFESIHNKAYWDRKQYKGFGLSASSFDGAIRLTNTSNLINYLKKIKNGWKEIIENKDLLTRDQELLEIMMLSLRQAEGVDLHRVLYYLESEKKEGFLKNLKALEAESLIKQKSDRIYLTPRGMVLENEVILKLL